MPKLTKDQPETMKAVLDFANKNGGLVPTAIQLKKILGLEERAASARLKRLTETFPEIFIQEGRRRRLNYSGICTEPETARLLLSIYLGVAANEDGRIKVSEVEDLAKIKNASDFGILLNGLCVAGYLQRVSISPEELRVGHKLFDHIELIKKIVDAIHK